MLAPISRRLLASSVRGSARARAHRFTNDQRRSFMGGWFGRGKGAAAAAAAPDAPSDTAAATAPDAVAEAPAVVEAAALQATTPAVEAAAPVANGVVDVGAAIADAAPAVAEAVPLGYYPGDFALSYIDLIASSLDVSYGAAIVGGTILLRSALFPLSIVTMKHTARMQKAKPEMEVLQARMTADEAKTTDRRRQEMYQRQMGALLQKHDVKPYLIFAFPLVQMPLFMGMFFGLRRLCDHFPAAHAGGLLWFDDLGAPDDTMVLPLLTSALFLAMVEVGADGMAAQSPGQQQMFRNVMRGLAVAMVPMTYTFPSGVFCYWVSANSFSLLQTTVLNKVPGAREALGVPRAPPPKSKARKPGAPPEEDVFSRMASAVDKAKAAASGERAAPAVAADQFDKKAEDNAFLASRPHDAVATHTHRKTAGKGGGGKKKGRGKKRK